MINASQTTFPIYRMKAKALLFFAWLLLLATGYPNQTQTAGFQTAETNVSTSNRKKTVTITSDGKNTIKRTVTVVDGVEKVVTETTDENGKTTRTEGDAGESGDAGDAERNENGAWLGIRTREVSQTLRGQLDLADGEGLVVELLATDGPAQKGGIREGDLLLAIGGSPISTPAELTKVLQSHRAGETIEVTIMRKGKRNTVDVELGAKPAARAGKAPEGLADGFGKSQAKSVGVSAEGEEVGKVFDTILDDPNLPESFKESVRRMQKMLRDSEQRGEE